MATGRRLAMAVVGTALLGFYLLAAVLGARLLGALWRARPDPVTAVAVLLGVALGLGYLSYRFGTSRLLAELHAVPLPRTRAPEIHRRLDGLAGAMDVERPQLLVANLAVPNALAVGGGREGALVLDAALFDLLAADEVEALMAHELAHLEGRDSLVQSLTYGLGRTLAGIGLVALLPVAWLLGGLARAVALLRGRPLAWPDTVFGRLRGYVGRLSLLAVLLVTVAVLAHSRRREYAADDRAVAVTGAPLALASALRTVARAADPEWGIVSPLYGLDEEQRRLARLFSTHPPLEERIERLTARAG